MRTEGAVESWKEDAGAARARSLRAHARRVKPRAEQNRRAVPIARGGALGIHPRVLTAMKRLLILSIAALAAAVLSWHFRAAPPVVTNDGPPPRVATYSIVARDPATGELGVAVQSRVLGVGAIVPYAKAGVGAVATQSMANTAWGPDGLTLLAKGQSAEEVLKSLVAADPQSAQRQAGILAPQGAPATFTGSGCMEWAGSRTGEHFTAQGNILAGPAVVDGMAEVFTKTTGTLAERMLAALDAAQAAGGDKRGMQSAALLVVRHGWGYGGQNDRYLDLRVDDHAAPLTELRRLLGLHGKLFGRPKAKPPEKSPD